LIEWGDRLLKGAIAFPLQAVSVTGRIAADVEAGLDGIKVCGKDLAMVRNNSAAVGNDSAVVGNSSAVVGNNSAVVGNGSAATRNGLAAVGNDSALVRNGLAVVGNDLAAIGNDFEGSRDVQMLVGVRVTNRVGRSPQVSPL